MFWRATLAEAKIIKEVLKLYEKSSRQQVNFNKSSVSFSKNTTTSVRLDISRELTIPEANENEKYLRVPTNVGRKKKLLFGFMKERLRQRMQGWSAKLLSRAGKEVLLKSVA